VIAAKTQADASRDLAAAAKISAQTAQAALQPALALRITMGKVTDSVIQYDIKIRNEGGSAAGVTLIYCALNEHEATRGHSVDECGADITRSARFTVLPHTEYPIAISLSNTEMIRSIRAEKAYLFIPIRLEYEIFGKPRNEEYCFLYREFFKGMSDCSDVRSTKWEQHHPN
jgi:hypothetical protein